MKKITSIALLLCMQICFVQCKDKVAVETYKVTPEFAEKIDKPEVHFTVDIPKSLQFDKPEPGKKTSSYGMIQKIIAIRIYTIRYQSSSIRLRGQGDSLSNT